MNFETENELRNLYYVRLCVEDYVSRRINAYLSVSYIAVVQSSLHIDKSYDEKIAEVGCKVGIIWQLYYILL